VAVLLSQRPLGHVHACLKAYAVGFLVAGAAGVLRLRPSTLLIGSIPGGLIGSHLATRMPIIWLRRLLCALLLITRVRMGLI
jgi:uncharacterized membrane protein YfcA